MTDQKKIDEARKLFEEQEIAQGRSVEMTSCGEYLDGVVFFGWLNELDRIDAEYAQAQKAAEQCETMQRPKSECGCPDCGSSLIDCPETEPAPAQDEREAPQVVAWLSWVPGYDGDVDSRQAHFTEKEARSRIEFISPFLEDVDEARADALMTVAQHERIVAALTHSAQTEQQPVVLEGWRAGVEAVAAMIEKKADDYAAEFGHIDMGALSFGIGHRADIKRDHHSSLVELAEEVRTTLAAPIVQTALNSDCEWCAGAGKDHLGEKCEHCQAAPLRYTNDGSLAECPCCGSLDVGGAHDTVHCYRCGLTVTKPRPLKNAIDAWNMRTGKQTAPQPEQSGLADLVRIALHNGQLVPDPEMSGSTEVFGIKLDDMEALEAALSAQGQSNGDS